MPKIVPVVVVSFFEGVGGQACVGAVKKHAAGRGLAGAAVARPRPALRTNSRPILRTAHRPAHFPVPVTIPRIELGGRIGHCVYLVWGRLDPGHLGRVDHTTDQAVAP